MCPREIVRRSVRWGSVLAEPGGPGGVHDRVLLLAREYAVDAKTDVSMRALAGSDEALAAVAVLRGPTDCRDVLTAFQPLVRRIGHKATMFPTSIDDLAALMLLALTKISETVGQPLVGVTLEVERKLADLVVDESLSPADRTVAALLALDAEQVVAARGLAARRGATGPGSSSELVKVLGDRIESPSGAVGVTAAWDAFLRGFPAALRARTAEWRHLVLAGRIVLGKLGGTPMGDVAEALRRRRA